MTVLYALTHGCRAAQTELHTYALLYCRLSTDTDVLSQFDVCRLTILAARIHRKTPQAFSVAVLTSRGRATLRCKALEADFDFMNLTETYLRYYSADIAKPDSSYQIFSFPSSLFLCLAYGDSLTQLLKLIVTVLAHDRNNIDHCWRYSIDSTVGGPA
jgi:hypothetical protein